nr:ATP-binding protein [Ottowia sp.]
MDGFQGRLNASLQRKLSLALLGTIAGVALVAGVLSFAAAYDEAQELQDDVLRQVATLTQGRGTNAAVPALADTHFADHDDASRLYVQVLGQDNPRSLTIDQGGPLPVPVTTPDGLHTMMLSGESFRVLVKTSAGGMRIVVAQEADFRDDIAQGSALRTVLPFAVLVPILLFVVVSLVRRMFRPVVRLAEAIDRRGEGDLQPIADHNLPAEVRPFVRAINRLLGRVAQTLDGQRRFVADAAHELRSPLTALSLQAERLQQAPMSELARERLAVLRQGIERGRALLEQLLSLARAQQRAEPPAAGVSMQAVFRRVLQDLLPLAEARQIDVGVAGEGDARVPASELDLLTLVKNLVDNAIRYTPAGGRVDLSVESRPEGVLLRIQDSGPGIAPAERERVFDPFYRTPGNEQAGSGLGLAIVQAIAQRLGARVSLDDADPAVPAGLLVRVLLPAHGEAPLR